MKQKKTKVKFLWRTISADVEKKCCGDDDDRDTEFKNYIQIVSWELNVDTDTSKMLLSSSSKIEIFSNFRFKTFVSIKKKSQENIFIAIELVAPSLVV